MRRVYLDNAATTYVNAEVMTAMLPYFTSAYGNAASIHGFGREAEIALSRARAEIAKAINAEPGEIYFTSGATESNNWILRGVLQRSKIKRALVSRIEHPSILATCEQLKKEGFVIEYIDVDSDGVILATDLISKLAKPAALVSVITANNEVGTVQYINTLANIASERGAYFHTDATQALGSVFIDVKAMKIDALSLSAHKIYGPKGIGALYIRKGVPVSDFMLGGHQERGHRAGTSNVAAAVGFGIATNIAMRDSSINNARIKQLRDYMIREIESKIEHSYLNGHRIQRLPNNVNFSFRGVEGEGLLMLLDFAGIAVSTGSACSSGVLQRSHVLAAMNKPDELAQCSIRFSLGRNTTKDDIDYTIKELVSAVKKLRSISALK